MSSTEKEISHGTANEADNSAYLMMGDVNKSWSANQEKTELIEYKDIDETPFTAVKVADGWFLAMGRYRLSDKYETYEQVLEDSKDTSWHRLMMIVQAMIEEHHKIVSTK